MKKIRVLNERWFRTAPFHDVKMLGIKYLDVPADRFTYTTTENFKRALVRQLYARKFKYGEEFEIAEVSNPFGTPKRRKSTTKQTLVGEYRFIKNGLRAPKEDIRWAMMEVIKEHTSYESARAAFEKMHGTNIKFKSTGKLEFTFDGMLAWAEKLGWIVGV